MTQLEQIFKDIFQGEQLIRMIFSSKRKKSCPYQKVTIRPVKLNEHLVFQAEYTVGNQVIHENLLPDEAEKKAMQLLKDNFKQINLFTIYEDMQVLAAKPDRPRIVTKPATKGMPSLSHNREKKRLIPEGEPCDFLIRLGVMDENGKVVQKHYSKYRQINRYVEIVEDVFACLPRDRRLRIIDFGCGKAYLTFALYYYLKVLKGKDVQITGLDLKKDVIRFCSKVAEDLGYDQLQFLMGDIADYTSDYADMVVTLHACDTATDYALINAVNWNSRVILSVPCCQHELFGQIKNELHQPMLKYGILKDRLTEYLTDGLRGLKLEAAGYDVAMIEFTSLEHTARNIMIKAVKAEKPDPVRAAEAQKQYEDLRDFYHVHPAIEQLPLLQEPVLFSD